MGVICSFGELLLRLSPELDNHWLSTQSMRVSVGGAELNVARTLASWGLPVRYISAMPANSLTKEILGALRAENIDTSYILQQGERLGTYYLPMGSELKSAGVIYDRAFSAFASLSPGVVDWDKALLGVSRFHFSAITPALSSNLAALCKEGVEAAAMKGIPISVDLNYRSKLWQYGVKPSSIMQPMVEYCDMIMGNIWSAKQLLDITLPSFIESAFQVEEYKSCAVEAAAEMFKKYSRVKCIANTFRFEHHDGIRYFGTLHYEDKAEVSKEYFISKVVDKVGSGDCFMAGLLFGLQQGRTPISTINFAAAAAVGKLQHWGDFAPQSIASIDLIQTT